MDRLGDQGCTTTNAQTHLLTDLKEAAGQGGAEAGGALTSTKLRPAQGAE